MAKRERGIELSDQFRQNDWVHQKKGARQHKLGTLMVSREEFPVLTAPLPPGQQPMAAKQYYDPRYNVWACKFIVAYWNRNAYSTDAAPIKVKLSDGTDADVWCHIDITTPRENFLWHGNVEGPHIVVEGFKLQGDTHAQKPKTDGCIWISPETLYELALHQHASCADGKAPGQEWPLSVTDELTRTIVSNTKPAASGSGSSSDSSGDEGGFGSLFA